MTDTLYRIEKLDADRFPLKVSRVRAILRRGLATGSETSPVITERGREILRVAMRDPNFLEPQTGTVGAQRLTELDDSTVDRVLTLL